MQNDSREQNRLKALRRWSIGAILCLPLTLLLAAAVDLGPAGSFWPFFLAVLLFCGMLILILVLNAKIRRATKRVMAASTFPVPPAPNVVTSISGAGLRFSLDAFIMQQGLVSIILLLVVLIWMVPSALIAQKESPLRRFRARRAAAYLVAALCAVGVIRFNNLIAERRALVVIAAVRQYEQKYGKLPDRLQQITPEFIPSIPLAKYALMYNDYQYSASPKSHRLTFVAVPPFGRRVFHFESGGWGSLD